MDELHFNGKKYISSKRAALLTGYTKDYIGQLCRAEKIEGRLVGRNWYINEMKLIEHKDGGRKKIAPNRPLSEYAYEPLSFISERKAGADIPYGKNTKMNYKHDEGILIPNLKKTVPPQTPEKESVIVPRVKAVITKTVPVTPSPKQVTARPTNMLVKRAKTQPGMIFAGVLVSVVILVGLLGLESVTRYSNNGTGVDKTTSFHIKILGLGI